MTDATETSPNFLRKMSVKTICGKVEKNPKNIIWLATIYGIATDIKAGSTNLGEYEALLGTFEAVNKATGERFQSGQLFLPPPADMIIISKVRSFLKNEGSEPVQFAVEVGVQPDAGTEEKPNAYGYQYIARQIIKTSESNMLTALREDVEKAMKALPAPVKGK